MEWKKISEEFPPLKKKILYGRLTFSGHSEDLDWFPTYICRPFDENRKFNPEFYFYVRESHEFELHLHDYWMAIENPPGLKEGIQF